MKVYCVSEEGYGDWGVVSSIHSAVEQLIKVYVLDDDFSLWDEASYSWKTLVELFGENWKDVISNFSLDTFLKYFDGCIHLYEYELDNF